MKGVSGCVSGAFGVVAGRSEYAALQQLREKVWRLPLLPPGTQQHFESLQMMSSAAAVLDSQTVVHEPEFPSVVDPSKVNKFLGIVVMNNLMRGGAQHGRRPCEFIV